MSVLSSDRLGGIVNRSSAADNTWSIKEYGSQVVDAVLEDSWANCCLSDYIK